MNNLDFNSGVKTYKVNGGAEISFNPTDANFIQSLYTTMEDLEKASQDFEKRAAEVNEEDPVEIFKLAGEKDAVFREKINALFPEEDACTAMFGKMHVDALTDDGLPLWANFLLAVLDACGGVAYDKLLAKGNAKINKYLNKYKKTKK